MSEKTDAQKALEHLEQLTELDSPIHAMKFMASLSRYPSLGPDGPLHARFVACLDKLKAKMDDRVYGRVPITDEEITELAKLRPTGSGAGPNLIKMLLLILVSLTTIVALGLILHFWMK